MKLKNAQIAASLDPLARLIGQPLPVGISFKLKKLKKALAPVLDLINEEIKSINDQYTVKDDAGNNKPVVDQNGKVLEGYFILSKEGVAERIKLDAVESEVEVEQINIADLPEKTLISEADLEALDWLLI
jgi:hypothetical protein